MWVICIVTVSSLQCVGVFYACVYKDFWSAFSKASVKKKKKKAECTPTTNAAEKVNVSFTI